MILAFEQLALWLALTIVGGSFCVRMLETRDIRRMAHQQGEQWKRHPQMRLFY